MKEQILQMLKEEFPEIAFEQSDKLVEDGVIDSIVVTSIIAMLTMEFGVTIPYEEITEENFNSVESMAGMVEKLRG